MLKFHKDQYTKVAPIRRYNEKSLLIQKAFIKNILFNLDYFFKKASSFFLDNKLKKNIVHKIYKNMKLKEVENIIIETSVKAAIACHKWIGLGKSNDADEAAVEAMRDVLDGQRIFRGKVVIGEGERDVAPMLYIGEELGDGFEKFDIAVDPLEGTSLCADNKRNSITAIAIGKGILHAPDLYMEKIASIKEAEGIIDLDNSIEDNIKNLAELLGKDVCDINITILERERHKNLISRAREIGAKVSLIQDGDVGAVIASVIGDGVDMYIGTGGAPEGVLAACALKTLNGFMQTRLIADTEEKVQRAKKMGVVDINRKYLIDDMVSGDVLFAITGVTNGDICEGVIVDEFEIQTQTMILNSEEKTKQFITLSKIL